MAAGALFIGWGPVIHGRERSSFEVFNESIEYFGRLQQQGTIDAFEPVALEPHGGDLAGFILLRGDREQLSRLRTDEEFIRVVARASFVVTNVGVVGAYAGEDLQRFFGIIQEQISEFGSGSSR